MKSFNEWYNEKINAHECLIDDEGVISDEYPCRSCEEIISIECEPHEFDPDMHYCGGSPSCCP